jgi:hypothetical protein
MENDSPALAAAPVITGPFYSGFLEKRHAVTSDPVYGPDERDVIQSTVRSLLALPTTSKNPIMLLGKIQSGKTKTFQGIMALAFDNGFDIAVIITKPTTALTKQTYKRVRKDFGDFIDSDQAKAYDILELPTRLSEFERKQKLVFILKKQTHNLERLREALVVDYPELASKRILIVDDEADHASIGYSTNKTGDVELRKIAEMIDDLRHKLPNASFLQVTATPYSLYLQPEDSPIPTADVFPVKPEATKLVPVHKNYIGGEYYFEKSKDPQSPAYYMYAPIKADELNILKEEDRRSFKLEDCLSSARVVGLRAAIVAFLAGGMIRRWQDKNVGQKPKLPKRFAFLFHTEQSRSSHSWQERVVIAIYESLKAEASKNSELLKDLVNVAHNDLERSIKLSGLALPSFEVTHSLVLEALNQDQVTVTKVNSEAQVASLLDDEGQLGLRTPLNIFIGGQILDRGITIANLIGFYYGRSPQKFQQDTVLQHSRMYGFRDPADCAVTRFHTASHIYKAMRRMHEADEALRERIRKEGDDRAVKFIELDADGRIAPCARSKILASNIMTIKAHDRILPYGFKTVAKTNLKPITEALDKKLASLAGPIPALKETPGPKEVSLADAEELLNLVGKTFKEFEPGYEDTWNETEYKAILRLLSESAINTANRGNVYILLRGGRNTRRVLPSGKLADSPDTGEGESRVAKMAATDIPVLILIRQEGLAENGWTECPFWWPVLITPAVTRTTLFAR